MRWWRKTYRQSTKSVEFERYTWFELLVEFYEDYFEENPVEMLRAGKDKDGNIQFETGDEIIDRWEKQIAKGQMPDLTEGMTQSDIEKLRRTQPASMVDTLAKAQEIVDKHVAEKKAVEQKFRLDGKI